MGDNVGALVALTLVGLIVARAAIGAAVWGPRVGAVVVGAMVLTTGDVFFVGANVMNGLETGEDVAGCNVGLEMGALVGGGVIVFLVVGCAVVDGIASAALLLVLVSLLLP